MKSLRSAGSATKFEALAVKEHAVIATAAGPNWRRAMSLNGCTRIDEEPLLALGPLDSHTVL